MSSVTAVGWTNYAKTGTISANSEAANSGAANLSSDQCSASTGWRTVDGVVTSAGGALLRIDAATAASVWRAFSLVNTNLTANAAVTITVWNNGSPPTSVWSTAIAGPPSGYRQVVVLADDDVTGDFVQIQIDDPGNPDNYIAVGGIYVGPVQFLETGRTFKCTFGRTAQVDEIVSWGGQEYPRFRYQQRMQEIDLDGVRDDEVWDLIDSVWRSAVLGGNVLWVPDTTSENLPQEVIFGRLKSTANIGYVQNFVDRRTWAATITERL